MGASLQDNVYNDIKLKWRKWHVLIKKEEGKKWHVMMGLEYNNNTW